MNWIRGLGTTARLVSGFAAVGLLTAAVGWVGLLALTAHGARLDQLYRQDMRAALTAKDLALAVVRVGRTVRQLLLEPQAEERARLAAALDQGLGQADELLGQIGQLRGAAEQAGQLRSLLPDWRAALGEVTALAKAERMDAARARLAGSLVTANQITASLDGLAESADRAAARAQTEAGVEFQAARARILWCTGGAITLGILLGVWLARQIVASLRRAGAVLEAAAAGDFTRRVTLHRQDELGQLARSVDLVVTRVGAALQQVRGSADAVAGAASQLSTAVASISGSVQEQAASLEETSASLQQITQTARQNADNAQHASQLAGASRDVAQRGGDVVASAVAAMGEINQSARKIADITLTIDEIAFQTNLLALNAAVEAARAGEQGRGFAVVASEVRGLAQRAATAAREIKGLIQESVRKVEGGSELVNRSGTTLGEIVTSVKQVTDLVAEIAAASQEQTSGIGQVGGAVVRMEQLTQGNAGQAGAMTATAQALAGQARELRAMVDGFRVDASPPPASLRTAPRPPIAPRPAVAAAAASAPTAAARPAPIASVPPRPQPAAPRTPPMPAVAAARVAPDAEHFEEM